MSNRVNLLPVDVRRRSIIVASVRIWSLALGMGGIVIALLAIGLSSQLTSLQTKCDAQAEGVASVTAARQLREQLTETLNARQSVLNEMLTLQASEDPLRMVLSVGAAANDDPGNILITSLEFRNETETPGNRQSPGSEDDEHGSPATLTRMTLRALSSTDLSVARFVMQLRESGEFDSVALRSSLQTDPDKEPRLTREFVVEGRRVNLR